MPSITKTRIRKAETQDIFWLLPKLLSISHFYNTKKSLFGGGLQSKQMLELMIDTQVFLIAFNELEGPVGFIGGHFFEHPFNPKIRVLAETFWWIDDTKPNSDAGALLLDAFTLLGKQKADWITFTIDNHSPMNEKSLFKHGYNLHERNFLMEV
jgi:hypothetical protein